MTHEEMIAMRNFVGAGTAKLSKKRKRARSGSPALDELTPPPTKKYNGDVGEVVGHCMFSHSLSVISSND
jgi:hypothetical protein